MKIVTQLQLSVVQGRSLKPKPIEFVVDSAAAVSTITESEFNTYFPGETLLPSPVRLKNFDNTSMKNPLGTVLVSAQYENKPSIVIPLQVVGDSCFSVLGLPTVRPGAWNRSQA